VDDLPFDLAGLGNSPVILANMAILRMLAGDALGAIAGIQAALAISLSPELVRLAAEYFYDFGDLRRSAELFSLLPDEAALGRQADALWLAGYTDSARRIWTMQADSPTALYNLAIAAPTREESAALLERLVRLDSAAVDANSPRRFGLIRYSRLLDAPQAIAVLNAERSDVGPDALIDLEILRRRAETAEIARVIAEMWMLLETFPDAEDLYQWGAWYCDYQRNHTESDVLLMIAARHGFTGPWKGLHGALGSLRQGDLDAAEEALVAVAAAPHHWTNAWVAQANLGRILEARHAPARALASYERALASVLLFASSIEGWQRIASQIQLRIAFCHRAMGRATESRSALEYALELNPDNLVARLELSRLE
jgi:tetratricopeptide (TPR) repeat protein